MTKIEREYLKTLRDADRLLKTLIARATKAKRLLRQAARR